MEKKKTKMGLISVLLFLIAFGLSPNLWAQSTAWLKSGSTWTWADTTGEGSGLGVPDLSTLASGDNITFEANGATIGTIGNATVGAVTVNSGIAAGTLTDVTSIASISLGGTLQLGTGTVNVTGAVTGTGTLTVAGTTVAEIGSITDATTLTASTTGKITFTGASSFKAGVNFAGDVEFGNTATFAGNVTFGGEATFGSTLTFTGTAACTLTIAPSKSYTFDGLRKDVTVAISGAATTTTGTVIINGETITTFPYTVTGTTYAWQAGTAGTGWYQGATSLGSTGAALNGKVKAEDIVNIVAPNPNFTGYTGATLGDLRIGRRDEVITIPVTVASIGKIIPNAGAGNYTVVGSGQIISAGAIHLTETGVNLTLKNPGGRFDIRAGSPAIYIDGANTITVDTTSFGVGKDANDISIFITNGGVFTYNMGNTTNRFTVAGTTSLGGLTAGGTLTINGTGRVSTSGPFITFTDAVDLGAILDHTTWSATPITAAAGHFAGNLNVLTTRVEFTATIGKANNLIAGGTLDVSGSDVLFVDVATFNTVAPTAAAGIATVTTDRNTSFRFNADQAANFPVGNRELLDLHFANATVAVFPEILTIFGNYTLGNLGSLPKLIGTGTLTVNGKFDATPVVWTAAEFPAGSKLILNGPIAHWGAPAAIGAFVNLDLIIGGADTIQALSALMDGFRNLTMNRAGERLVFGAVNSTIAQTLTVTQGTVKAPVGAFTFTVTGATTVSGGGVLDLDNTDAAARTFTLAVSNSGLIRAAGGSTPDNPTVVFSQGLAGTGTLETNNFTALTFAGANKVDLPESVSNLQTLIMNLTGAEPTLTLQGDLRIHGPTAGTTGLVATAGTLMVAGRKLTTNLPTFGGAIDVRNGSIFEMTGAFGGGITAAQFLSDSTTSIIVNGTAASAWTPADGVITKLKNLTLNANGDAATYLVPATQAEFEILENLNINVVITGGNATFTASNAANTLTVRGDVSINSAVNATTPVASLVATSATVNLYGMLDIGYAYNANPLTNIVTALFVTDNTTVLNILGEARQFQLPLVNAGATAPSREIGRLVLNRPAGMRLNSVNANVALLTVGVDAAGVEPLVLDIQRGSLDLNGNNITFRHAESIMKETAGNVVINTGASNLGDGLPSYADFGQNNTTKARGAIYTIVSATLPQINSIGIAGTGLDVEAVEGAYRRYPKSVNVPGIGRSTRRYYYVATTKTPEDFTLAYDNRELVASEFAQKIYIEQNAVTDAFSNGVELRGNTTVTPAGGNGIVRVNKLATNTAGYTVSAEKLNAGTYIFALAAPPNIAGVQKTWTNATGDNMWFTAGNWSPAGVPTIDDQVVIEWGKGSITTPTLGDVYISGNNSIATAGQLFLDGQDVTLFGSNSSAGEVTNLQIKGNIYVENGASIAGVRGRNLLNLIVGDGSSGIASMIDAAYTDDAASVGAWFNDVTINSASFRHSNGMRLSGNLTMTGSAALDAGEGVVSNSDLVFYGGGASGVKTVAIPQSASAVFSNIVLDNKASYTTNANFQLNGRFLLKDADCRWNATGGSVLANNPNGQEVWNTQSGGTLELFDLEVGHSDAGDAQNNPKGNVYFKGTLSKIGTNTFAPVATPWSGGNEGNWAVYFQNPTGQTEIIRQAGNLFFHNLVIAKGTKTITSSDFNIRNYLLVDRDADFDCQGGTVRYDGTGLMTIENVSTQTLTHNDVIIDGRVTTPSSWNLRGNLTVTNTANTNEFRQTAGTISITNDQPRSIQDRSGATKPAITFNRLNIIDGAVLDVKPFKVSFASVDVMATTPATAANTSFEIKNYGANGTMPTGIEVAATGIFKQHELGTVYFETDGTVTNSTDANSKWINNNGADTNVRFGNIKISAGANNVVRTESSFEIIGSTKTADPMLPNFLVAGGGARFDATGGTVSFTGIEDRALIAAISGLTGSGSNCQFANIRSAKTLTLNLNTGDEIFVSGNMIADGSSQFLMGTTATTGNPTAKVVLNGKTAPQYLTGNTDVSGSAFTFTFLQINKGSGNANYPDNPYADPSGLVYLERDVAILPAAAADPGTFILTNGVLNLGTRTLTMGARSITRQNGAIDGAKGTYIIAAEHQSPKLEDVLFRVGNETNEPIPTLWNLTVNHAHRAVNDLTVNNNMDLRQAFTLAASTTVGVVEPKLLTIYGNLTQLAPTGVLETGWTTDNTMSRLVLKGTGTVTGGLRNALFSTTGNVFSITVGRAEALGAGLTMDDANLTIATGVNTLSLNGQRLTLSNNDALANPTGITLVSGSITADNNSVIDFVDIPIIPANLFTRSEAGTVVLGASEVEMRGDLTINTALTGGAGGTGAFKLNTGDNVLTLAQGRTLSNPGATRYIIGNLVQTVTNAGDMLYPIGNFGTNNYNPVTIRYQGQGINQQIMATVKDIDPVAGRGGDAKASINAVWTLTPLGDAVLADALLRFGWSAGPTAGVRPATVLTDNPQGKVFAAKWDNGRWFDYRNTINVYSVGNLGPALNSYPVNGSAGLAGSWAIFAATVNTDASKNDAISTTKDKIVITAIEPMPTVMGRSFRITMALQDQYGQPITSTVPLPISINFHNGGVKLTGEAPGSMDAPLGSGVDVVSTTFQANRSEMSISLSIPDNPATNNSPIAQLIAAVGGDEASKWTPAISEYFSVLPAAPASQPNNITFSRVTYISATAKWDNPSGADYQNVIVIAKADTLLTPDEYPKNGVTYIPNVVYGAGSNIGNATVLYNGTRDVTNIDIAGLLPNTEYYVYVFAYSGKNGNENYKTNAAMRNPNSFRTKTGTHDDITLGGRLFSNETYGTSATIGTNATFAGTIFPAGDIDQFNFMVTSAAPNVRVLLTGLAGDYTVELYDFTNRRIRRSTLNGLSNEALVANNLPAGTYVVKIFAVDGSSWVRPGNEYKLLINTFSSEIFSVTPTK